MAQTVPIAQTSERWQWIYWGSVAEVEQPLGLSRKIFSSVILFQVQGSETEKFQLC